MPILCIRLAKNFNILKSHTLIQIIIWGKKKGRGTGVGCDFRIYLFCHDLNHGQNPCSHCFLFIVAVYIFRLFSAVKCCPFALASRSCASHHWIYDARELPSVLRVCGLESCLFSVMEMCLHSSLVGTVIINSASILPSSFLRNLKRAGTKVASSGGDRNQRMGTTGEH